jgi:TonB family protein
MIRVLGQTRANRALPRCGGFVSGQIFLHKATRVMATAPRQASPSPAKSNRDSLLPPDSEQATVEESPRDLDLVNILREAASSGSQPLEAIADAIADAARILSGADGTALGMETKGMIVCRARSGDIAPPTGAPISTESGISGECLRTATMLVCHDAMTDPRVDTEVCRSLGIRSVAAVPVRGPMGAAGILEAFAARPNSFDGDALRSLRELAVIAEMAYMREAREHGLRARPLPAFQSATTYSTPPLATEDIVNGLSESNKKRLWIVGTVALTLLLTVAVAWWSWHVPADEATVGGQSVHAASAEPAHAQPAPATPKPGPGVPTVRSEHSRPQVLQNASELKPMEGRPETIASTASGAPDTVQVRIPTGTSSESSPVPEPPVVELAPSANAAELARLSSVPTAMPAAPPRVSQGVVEATLIHKVDPAYPMQARTSRLSGKVSLLATISADGSIRELAVTGGSPVLAAAAKTAVRQWRYRPATLNGSPVEVQKEIIIVFAQP